MVEKLKAHKIQVEIFEDQKQGLPDSVFSNNWMAHIPGGDVVVFPMCTENRRTEVRPDILDFISQRTNSKNQIDLRSFITENKFLEGTGSIVFDYRAKIAFASESPRTDVSLFEDFCKRINYKPISFQSTDLKGDLIYHTNVMMTVADGYALVCFDSISNAVERKMLELKLTETNHEIIPISFQQMNQFAGNCIEVLNADKQSFLLMSETAFRSLNSDQIAKIEKFSKILSFQIPVIETIGGGSVRCMITGVFVS